MGGNLGEAAQSCKKTGLEFTRVGRSVVVGGEGFAKFTQVVKLAAKEIALASLQFAAFTAALWAVGKIFEFVKDKFYEHSNALIATKKRAEEATEAYNSLKSEIESLEGELDTAKERINELLSKGSLSLVEQDELDKLRETNIELRTQIALKKQLAEDENKKATEAAYGTLKNYEVDGVISKTRNDDGSITYGEAYRIDIADQITDATKKYVEAKEALQNATSEKDIEKYTKELDKAQKSMNGLIEKANEQIDGKDWSVASEDAIALVEKTNKAIKQSLVQSGNLSPMDYIETYLSASDFEKFNNQMQEMADAGTTSVEAVKAAFQDSLPEVKQAMLDLGYTTENWADSLAEHIKSLASVETVLNNLFETPEKRMSDFQEKANKFGNTVDLLNRKKISGAALINAGWNDVDPNDIATVYSSAFSNEDGTQTVLVTPILPNGKVLTPEELESYANDLLAGNEIDVDIKLGMFSGKDSIDQSNKFANELHDLQEDFYLSSRDMSDLTLQEINDTQAKINEILYDTDFEINTDSIKNAFGDNFISALSEAGVSVKQFCEYLKNLQGNIDKISIKDVTEELSNVESTLDSLSDAYADFRDNDGEVSSSTLDGLVETFKDLEDTSALNNLINVLSDTSSSVKDVETAMDSLVDTYISQEVALSRLTEENKQLYINQLKKNGITNAAAVVEAKLALAQLKAGNATAEETYEIWKQVSALDDQEDAALQSALAIEILKTYQDLASGSSFTEAMETHANAILELANAAGIAAPALSEMIEIMAQIDYYQAEMENARKNGDVGAMRGIASQIAVLKRNAEELRSSVESDISKALNTQISVDYTPNYTSSSSSDDETTNKDLYDEQKDILDNKLERNLISYNKYYKELVKLGNTYLKGDTENMREHYATLASVRKDAYDHYQEVVDDSLDKGIISEQEYFDQSKELADKWFEGRKSNAEDLADAMDEIYDKIISSWSDKISDQEDQISRMNLDKTWAPGQTAASIWEAKLEQLKTDYINNLFIDDDEYWDLYYEILEKIKDAKKTEWENQLDQLEEQSDNIQDLIDMVDDMLRQRLEDQIDLLEEQRDAYSDIIDKKKESLDLTKSELEYERELEEMNSDLADLQMKASVLALDDSREGKAAYQKVLAEIRQKQQDISDKQADYTYTATTNALDEADTKYQDSIQKKIDSLNDMTSNQGEWLEYVYSYIKTTNPSALFQQLYNYNYKYGTGMNSTVDTIKSSTSELLTLFNSDMPTILSYLSTQQSKTQELIDNSDAEDGEDGSGANYSEKIKSSLSKQVQASVTQKNTDSANRTLVTRLKDEAGLTTWYDEGNKVIYYGSEGDRRITAGAYNVIEKMRALNESGKTREEKEPEMKKLLKELRGKWSYKNAELKWNGNVAQLWKTPAMRVFHTGLKQGFVSGGSTYTPVTTKQNEVLALLQKGELVFNKSDEYDLLRKLQVLDTLTTSLKKMQLDGINQITNTAGDIYVTVEAPINVTGATNDEMMRQLDKFRRNLKDDTLTAVTDGLKKRGYKSPASGLRSK